MSLDKPERSNKSKGTSAKSKPIINKKWLTDTLPLIYLVVQLMISIPGLISQALDNKLVSTIAFLVIILLAVLGILNLLSSSKSIKAKRILALVYIIIIIVFTIAVYPNIYFYIQNSFQQTTLPTSTTPIPPTATNTPTVFEPLSENDIKNELPTVVQHYHDEKVDDRLPVYSGPGYTYYRENGNAEYKITSSLYTLASEDNWWLIKYNLTASEDKIGYIDTKEFNFSFSPSRCLYDNIQAYTINQGQLVNYPQDTSGAAVNIPANTKALVLLKYLDYAYVETVYKDQKIRGFMLISNLQKIAE